MPSDLPVLIERDDWTALGLILSRHGLGAKAGFPRFGADGDGEGRRLSGLGAIGGGTGFCDANSLGLGATGGFFIPVHTWDRVSIFQEHGM